MAHGSLLFLTVLRNQASPTTPEARGPPSLALWNGMGPSGYHRPPSFTFPSLKVCFIILQVLLMSAFPAVGGFGLRGGAAGEECQIAIGKCSTDYEIARQSLNISASGLMPESQVQSLCTALRTYRYCASKAVGCEGGIMFYSIRSIVDRQMSDLNCNKTGIIVEPSDKNPWLPVPPHCQYQGKKVFRHCGLFGDPHLRTFNGDFQTCRVKGAWPLVNNDYLIVQATNDPVEGNADATATSKLTVIVKGNKPCTSKDFQTYLAQTNDLPGAFEDGHVTYGPYRSLELVEVEPGRHVEIHIRYIDTIVVIRQIGHYFTFSIKMPEELVNSSHSNDHLQQLCAKGCGSSEQINYQEYMAKKKDTVSLSGQKREEVEEVCRDANLVGFYFDSCVYDLMSTGDQNFTLSALSSLQDILKLQPSASKTIGNRTSLQTYDQQYGVEGNEVGGGESSGSNGGGGSGGTVSLHSINSIYFKIQLLLVVFLTLFITRTSISIPSR